MMDNIILRKDEYALIDKGHEYIVACGFNEESPEGQKYGYGLHFEHWNDEIRKAEALSNALNCYREKIDNRYNSTGLLEIHRENYSKTQFQEILNVLNINDDEVDDTFMVYVNVVRDTLKEV